MSSSDEKPIPKRRREVADKMKPSLEDLVCKCNTKCFKQINSQTIDKIWDYFHSLESKNCQDTFIQTLIEVDKVKRRVKKNICESSFRRNHSYKYILRIGGEKQIVCKEVFIKIHGITRSRLERICKLLLKGKLPVDLRGKQISNAVPENICVRIHDHISRFEVKETHYGHIQKKYLDARLNVSKMHQMFIDENPDLKHIVKYSFYYTFIKDKFCYSFGRPQVDDCSQCDALNAKLRDKNLDDRTKRIAAAELMVHKRRTKKFFNSIKEASKNKDDETVALCFDYMQNLPLPHIPVREIFYMRQLWLNVFCINNLKTNSSKIYLYHEGVANKSADEVCSFLLNYLNTEVPKTVKKLILYSDGPSGENKNHTVVRFLMNLCDNGRFDSITHNFPIRGHSYLPCELDFHNIRRSIKNIDRIYTPNQYAQLILRASRTSRFNIHKVISQDIKSFKKWWPLSYKKIAISDETSTGTCPNHEKKTFKVSTYRQFCYNKNLPGKVVVRRFIDGYMSSTFTLLKTYLPPTLPTEMAYPLGKVPINVKKIKDLQALKPYLVGYEEFYENIFQWPTTHEECNIERVYEDE